MQHHRNTVSVSRAYPNISRTSERGDRLCSNVDLVMIHFMRRLRKVAPAQKKEAAMPEDTKEYQDLFRELDSYEKQEYVWNWRGSRQARHRS